ncbi:MAG: type 1 glutamine amidotransferase domain-containing protein [Hyphomicrobium sp.]|jgi:protease I
MSASTSAFRALLDAEASAALPRLSTAQLLNAPENRTLRDLWTEPTAAPALYAGKRIGVISTDGVEEIEITTVLHFFRSRGATTHVIAPTKPAYPPSLGVQVPDLRATHILTVHYIETAGWIAIDKSLDDVNASAYDVFIVPGGSWNPDALRADPKVIRLLKDANATGKILAAICHGPWVLSDAGLLKGKRAAAWWPIRPDIENAGATFVDEPAVVDGNIITSRAPNDLAAFVHAIGERLT